MVGMSAPSVTPRMHNAEMSNSTEINILYMHQRSYITCNVCNGRT